MSFNIFVSYSTDDISEVEKLKLQLEGTPIKLFIAEYSISPGENLTGKIIRAIKECDLFVVLWSKRAESSGWVSQEIGHANALSKHILPLVLSKEAPPPGFIKNLKYLPVHQDPERALNKAREIIMAAYDRKQKLLQEQKERDSLALLGLGAFLLWAFNK
ncbi:toll/interleukin-1 receptor domain-containing protein [Pleionea mediterranea]|uniref:TIR domain-containing protein n=1 Tax=Pleionea mediterranea TaxID=523701 RepID=A0A316FW48_9GAMM|nr:toll/interleukin-1 receptor domain-containing protein [Pleionea mediterranea]PWK52818.1 TIR domain-containing protein [Pleionea mediterranea]